MKIHNIRLNKAMNSSSTHSVLLLTDPDEAEKLQDSEEAKNLEFGWEYWTAVSSESKKNYLGIAIFENLRTQFPENIALLITKETFGIDLISGRESEKYSNNYTAYDFNIDHQSQWTLPWNYQETMLHEEFIEEFKAFLLRKGVVILGGNDNDEETHELNGQGRLANLKLPFEQHRPGVKKLIARKDKKFNYWLLFNRGTGAKIRMSFNE